MWEVHWLCLCWQPVVSPSLVPSDSVVEMPACKELFILCCTDAWVCETCRCAFPGSEFVRMWINQSLRLIRLMHTRL